VLVAQPEAELHVGESATFVVWRDGHEMELRATVAKRDEDKVASNVKPQTDEDSKNSANTAAFLHAR